MKRAIKPKVSIFKVILIGIKRNILDISIAAFATFLALIFVALLTYQQFASDLPDKTRIMNKNDTGVTLLDSSGKPFFTFFEAKQKSFVPVSKISKDLQDAVIAIEDEDFYTHYGLSFKGITRSVYLNFEKGGIFYGGSTITQQLVKTALLNPRKDFLRKYQELILSLEIERRYQKEEILEMYLNSVYFGEGAFGAEEASLIFFGKHAKDLTLAESSFLAGLLPSPSMLSPFSGNLEKAKQKQKIVLSRMYKLGYITKEEKNGAENTKLEFNVNRENFNSKAPHFALFVRDELIEKFGEEKIARSGFKVRTTINLEWQNIAEEEVRNQVYKLAGNNVSNAAAVVLDPKTGEIKAMVGSFDWYDDNFGKKNMVISPRQVGSSFKPIVYAAAFEKKLITPATILKDAPVTYYPNYKPRNYDGKFRGNVTVRRALANSLNVPSVEVMAKVGVNDSVEMAERLGVTTLNDKSIYGLSLVLGAGEIKLLDLTSAYAVFANNGMKVDPTSILDVTDKNGANIYTHTPNPRLALAPEDAFLISSILSDKKARNEVFGNVLDISRIAAVKTGTTEYYKDSLTVGYTPSLTIGVWVGNNYNSPMSNIAGSLGAAPIWKNLMEKYLAGTSVEVFNMPENITPLMVCANISSSKQATPSGYLEYFVKGTEPQGLCDLPKRLNIEFRPNATESSRLNFESIIQNRIFDKFKKNNLLKRNKR